MTAVEATVQQDTLLVQRHRAGDQLAFAELYEVHYPALLRFVRRRVRDDVAAEDLAQEAFTRALAASDRLRDPARFYPWLTTIARRLIIGHYRTRDRLLPVAKLEVGVTEGPDARLMHQAQQEDLLTALDRVRGRHRDVLRMREGEELSYEAIADSLGTPLTTIPPLLHRARQALRREYLAVTEYERTGALVPALVSVFEALRRLRDRLAQVAPYLPEPNALVGSVAAVAIGVGGLWAVGGDVRPEASSAGQPISESPFGAGAETDGSAIGPIVGPDRSQGRVPEARPESHGVAGFDNVTFDRREVGAGREHSRGMPYYLERGEHSLGVDPSAVRRDLGSSMSGDHTWMEGLCEEPDLGC